jgi:hypothetical protein
MTPPIPNSVRAFTAPQLMPFGPSHSDGEASESTRFDDLTTRC